MRIKYDADDNPTKTCVKCHQSWTGFGAIRRHFHIDMSRADRIRLYCKACRKKKGIGQQNNEPFEPNIPIGFF